MTVQELIERLDKIKDKSIPVVLLNWDTNGSTGSGLTLTPNRLMTQAHRLAILQ
jgi:hypothetical protein